MRRLGLLLLTRLAGGLPLTFRVLCRQFMLRVIDLEALSAQADVTGYLGQFVGIAIMGSMIHSFIAFIYSLEGPAARLSYAWHFEQYLIATMMLVAGLFAVASWDAIFPDKRDIMILGPLPIPARNILLAKLSASGAMLGIAVLALNVFSGFVWPFIVGMPVGGWSGVFRAFAAYWFTMVAATVFLYCSILTVQGITNLVLSRRLSRFVSASLQLLAFNTLFATYFLQGAITTPSEIVAGHHQLLLASSPSFWFFALFNQLNGTLPPYLTWLSHRAWLGLALALTGAVTSLLLCYLRAMRRLAEGTDLIRGTPHKYGALWLGSPLQSAIVQFVVRTLARSRQHRIILAFYLSIALAVTLSSLRKSMAVGMPRPFTAEFPMVTSLIMIFTVMGFVSVFSLPVSLTANWMLRTSQIRPSGPYIAATRRTLLLLAVLPSWLISAALGLTFSPFTLVIGHLAVLALLGVVLAQINLLNFRKVPFTCSLLPGSTNMQFVFWWTIGGIGLLWIFINWAEIPALHRPWLTVTLLGVLSALAFALSSYNRKKAKSAILYYEDLSEEVITTLRLISPAKEN